MGGVLVLACLMGTPAHAQHSASECVAGAAQHYRVHPAVILAVMRQEGGRVGQVSTNRNGTYDIGPMQINSSHLGELSRYGISRSALLNDGCLNIYIGTWLLKREMVASGSLWSGIGQYHSHTPSLSVDYQWRIWNRLKQLAAGR